MGLSMSIELRVARMQKDQVAPVTEILARALRTQLSAVIDISNAQRETEYIGRLREMVEYGFEWGVPYVACNERIVGVALWMPPHTNRMAPEEELELSSCNLPEMFRATDFGRFGPVADKLAYLHEQDMNEAHWYLPLMAIEPSCQSMGVGHQLVAPVLNIAAQEGVPCYVEVLDPRTNSFFKSLGFDVLASGAEPVSGLHYWTFRRLPNATGTHVSRRSTMLPWKPKGGGFLARRSY